MTITMSQLTVEASAEALFVTDLQPSDHIDLGHVPAVVFIVAASRGVEACAAEVAQAFGDHPEASAERMRWCRALVGEWFLRSES